ncbi:MAG: hypothetical protein KAT81_01210 [Syntrophobacterales bacterium]|nr:hypothetical protein [Syntrophobacterales bacterium]
MKTVKQIELWLNNVPGQLSAVSDILSDNRIDIIACCCAATPEEKGLFYFIVNDPDKAVNVLKSTGYKIKTKQVIACEMPNHPGGMNIILKLLKNADINLDYIYPCMRTGDITVVILGVGPVKKTLKIMEDNWIKVWSDDLYHI